MTTEWLWEFFLGTVALAEIFLLTLVFALPLGLFIALLRGDKNPFIWRPIHYYILLMRGTPLILQLVVVFYGPYYIAKNINRFLEILGIDWTVPEINMNRFWAAVIAYVLNYAAYFAEIYRGGIDSIPQGQYEAAKVLGLTRSQTFLKIILPQVVKRITLPMSNEFTTLVKDTALVSTLAVVDLYRVARNLAASTSSITPLFAAGAVYLALNYLVTRFFMWFEKKQSYYR